MTKTHLSCQLSFQQRYQASARHLLRCQLMAHLLGGKVGPAPGGEYGRTKLAVKNSEPLFTGTPTAQDVWMSHGDQVVELPASLK